MQDKLSNEAKNCYIRVFMVCLIRKLSWKFEEYTEE
jgi:hypothetical protein